MIGVIMNNLHKIRMIAAALNSTIPFVQEKLKDKDISELISDEDNCLITDYNYYVEAMNVLKNKLRIPYFASWFKSS